MVGSDGALVQGCLDQSVPAEREQGISRCPSPTYARVVCVESLSCPRLLLVLGAQTAKDSCMRAAHQPKLRCDFTVTSGQRVSAQPRWYVPRRT